MRYERVKKGIFLERPNRFIAHVRLEGQEEGFTVCHVKNTGRCRGTAGARSGDLGADGRKSRQENSL